ncbi:MAG: histidinol dehydrogenase, partial [Dehalococcoidia bacterium]|nr:histidinol dehydrogenase [Dehalococcoidia bacterium]
TLIIADSSASVDLVAADLLAQAEHDQLATPLLITDSADLASAVVEAVEMQLKTLDREAIARVAVANGKAIVVNDLYEAISLANEYAPEHLCLLVEKPKELIPSIVNAGGIFVGESSPEVLGDYTAGPSHIMPTGGSARYSSPLSVLDFLKITSIIEFDDHEIYRQGPYASELARSEGLTGHARSLEMRIEGN